MDAVVFLSVASSVASIASLGLEVSSKISKKSSKAPTKEDHNKNIFDSSVNVNSRNTTNINFDSHDRNSHNLTYNNYNSYNQNTYKKTTYTSNSSKQSSDDFGFMFLFLLLGGVITKFYLDNQTSIVFGIIILGIICFAGTLTCLLILNKQNLINSPCLFMKTIQWFPLFTGMIFIYHPLYKPADLYIVEVLIKNGTGYINILISHVHTAFFLLFQVLGLAAIAAKFLFTLVLTIRDTYKSCNNRIFIKDIRFSDIILYLLLIIFIFFLVTGLYIKLFNF